MTIKQLQIDNGQIGGVIQMFLQSMFIFNMLTFVNTSILVYQSFLCRYISFNLFFIVFFILLISWISFFYLIIYPSTVRFSNRQAYTHGSPIKADFEKIITILEDIKHVNYKKRVGGE